MTTGSSGCNDTINTSARACLATRSKRGCRQHIGDAVFTARCQWRGRFLRSSPWLDTQNGMAAGRARGWSYVEVTLVGVTLTKKKQRKDNAKDANATNNE